MCPKRGRVGNQFQKYPTVQMLFAVLVISWLVVTEVANNQCVLLYFTVRITVPFLYSGTVGLLQYSYSRLQTIVLYGPWNASKPYCTVRAYDSERSRNTRTTCVYNIRPPCASTYALYLYVHYVAVAVFLESWTLCTARELARLDY